MSRSIYGALGATYVAGAVMLAGCAGAIPTSGPSRAQIDRVGTAPDAAGIQIVDLTDSVARQLFAERRSADFATTLGDGSEFRQQLGIGDAVDVSIWEAPPATLFAASPVDGKG